MKGVVLRQLEKFNESLECFYNVLEFEPQNLATLHQIGRVYQNIGDFKKSIETFDQILKISPDFVPL